MKFKFKLLIVNIILLSVSLGIMGFLMIRMNFRLALDTLVDGAVVEHNMAQTYVEYELLEFINGNNTDMPSKLGEIGNNVVFGMVSPGSTLTIFYDDKQVFSNDKDGDVVPDSLIKIKGKVDKNYVIEEVNGVHYIYTASCNEVLQKYLQVVTKKSVEDAYALMQRQLTFFRIILCSIIVIGCIISYILATILTAPLVKLNNVSDEMADGNYKMRASVRSSDEIGQLAAKFNNMASSVDMHVNELEEQVHKREQFVADFTHEIKTPMTTIIGYADTMRSVELPREDQISSLNYIVSAGKRLEVMSRKLFDLIYLNRSDIEMSQITVDSIVRETERIVNPALLSADITLKKKIDPAMIYGNRDLLATAFINFIDNSRKASKQGSVIEFTGEVSEDNYILSVKDFGIGMKPEHVDKICDEFYMVDKSRSRREGSAGLGMSLASLIIKRHNAELKISSEENVGTCISVIFPLKKEEVSNYEK